MDNTSTPLPDLLTPEELADYLKISLRTIEGWRLSKKGPPHVPMGKHVRYRADHLAQWLNQQ